MRVEGRVQGVGYRDACVEQALSMGLTGWVRNRLDGSVEVLLQGAPEAVARMQAWLRDGPALARVERLTVTDLPASSEPLSRFVRRSTA